MADKTAVTAEQAEFNALAANLRELSAAATPGPWFAWDRGVGYMITLDPDGDRRLPEGMRTDFGHRPDAELIAQMRNELPRLLDRLEWLTAALNTSETVIELLEKANKSQGDVATRLHAAEARAAKAEEQRDTFIQIDNRNCDLLAQIVTAMGGDPEDVGLWPAVIGRAVAALEGGRRG